MALPYWKIVNLLIQPLIKQWTTRMRECLRLERLGGQHRRAPAQPAQPDGGHRRRRRWRQPPDPTKEEAGPEPAGERRDLSTSPKKIETFEDFVGRRREETTSGSERNPALADPPT